MWFVFARSASFSKKKRKTIVGLGRSKSPEIGLENQYYKLASRDHQSLPFSLELFIGECVSVKCYKYECPIFFQFLQNGGVVALQKIRRQLIYMEMET